MKVTIYEERDMLLEALANEKGFFRNVTRGMRAKIEGLERELAEQQRKLDNARDRIQFLSAELKSSEKGEQEVAQS